MQYVRTSWRRAVTNGDVASSEGASDPSNCASTNLPVRHNASRGPEYALPT